MSIKKHHLDSKSKGYFPVGAVAVSPDADEVLKRESKLSLKKERLPGKEGSKDIEVSLTRMRDTLLYLHKMGEFGEVSNEQKNHNSMAVGLGMGTVRSIYILPLTEVRIVVETHFNSARREVYTLISTAEEVQ